MTMNRVLGRFLMAAVNLTGCTQRPSDFVGCWTQQKQGLFSSGGVALSLKADGTGSLQAGGSFLGMGGSRSLTITSWKVVGDELITAEEKDDPGTFEIIEHSKNSLVIRMGRNTMSLEKQS